MDTILYRVIIFKVKDFTNICDSMFKSDNNSYKVSQVKNYFIQIIQPLKEYDLIENNYKLIQDGHIINTNKLTSKNIKKNINEGFILCEKLDI